MIRIRHIAPLMYLLIATVNLTSAQSEINSLIKKIESSGNDSTIDSLLNEINNYSEQIDEPDSVVGLWKELTDICHNKGFLPGVNYCVFNQAKILRLAGNYFESLVLLVQVLNYYKDIEDTGNVADVHNSLGNLYISIEQLDDAREQYILAIEGYRQLKDSVKIGWTYLNLGNMSEREGKYQEALQQLRISEKLLTKLDKKTLVNTYINFGETYKQMNLIDSARHYYQKACETAHLYGTAEERFYSNFYLGQFLFDKHLEEEAGPYIDTAIFYIANYQIQDFDIEDKVSYYELLSRYYESKNQYEKAFNNLSVSRTYDLQNKAQESINNLNRLEFDKKVAEAQRKRQQQNVLIIVILAGLFVSLLFLLTLYRSYKLKRKANRLLTEMDELKTRLFSNISHELRTPLTLILAPLEQMLSDKTKKTPSRKQIKMMRRNALELLNLVNQMLDLSKIDARNMALELNESNIVVFVRAHFASFASLAERKNIAYNTYVPDTRIITWFDASKLEKIINNLISNAIKYTAENGQVFCFASFPTSDQLEIVVQDTGQGIPENELSKIFDRFHQVKNEGSNQTTGTGIGLALVKELTEIMRGKINVSSVVGEGSKFKLSIPLGKEHLHPNEFVVLQGEPDPQSSRILEGDEQETCEESAEAGTKDQPEILIVEDHKEICDFIRENLRNCYRIKTASNGKEGLNIAFDEIPDLIVSDVMMPEMDGIEMSRKLKTDERTSHIPIILLTAKSGEKDKLSGLETGADAFMPKPFSMKELELRIKKLIENRRKLRERFTHDLRLEPKDIAVSSADEKFLERLMEIIE